MANDRCRNHGGMCAGARTKAGKRRLSVNAAETGGFYVSQGARQFAIHPGSRADSDEALLKSWLRSLNSSHSQRNFEVTARRFVAELPEGGLRAATVEDVRDALSSMSAGLSEASARQYMLRVKSLLGYAHALGYAPFNAGATIKVRLNAGNRGATLAKRIISEVEVGLLIRAAPSKRDRVLFEVIYAGGLRPSASQRRTTTMQQPRTIPLDAQVLMSLILPRIINS
jgi:integrase